MPAFEVETAWTLLIRMNVLRPIDRTIGWKLLA
jgi:hypothetical protein